MTFAYDYIIIGGGLAGTIVASGLHAKLPSSSILLLEAGEDRFAHPFTTEPLKAPLAHNSELDWNLSTLPQPHLGNRICYQGAGKALGGSAAINHGTWTRGPKVDYDRWAVLVGDARWSYNQLLPYFPKTEIRSAEEDVSRFSSKPGVVYTATSSQSHSRRVYGLRECVKRAWVESGIGDGDGDGGFPVGISERVENWNQGRRQHVHRVFGLDGVQVLTKSQVGRILFRDGEKVPVAYGVELVGGAKFLARKEVILSAGTYHSPKILMLSGIGEKGKLMNMGIQQRVESPYVGRNFHDHIAVPIVWRLREKKKEMNRSFGDYMEDPVMKLGWPSDWLVFAGLERNIVKDAIEKDGGHLNNPSSQLLLNPSCVFTETMNFYTPVGTTIAGMDAPMDGTCISSIVLGVSPTSRGEITISSADPLAPPVINPNYYATELDRVAIRSAVRKAFEVYQGSDALKDIVECEVPPLAYESLTAISTDDEIDDRVRRVGITSFDPAGSCSMGRVVDPELRVNGVKGLRIVDASVIPLPLAAHLQVAVHALGARAVEFVAAQHNLN
ncbi:GMC oxidoreductase [Penicillium odoratum]|uniref:GMC oxidoreductase n=1 Tax=Penicillium odoratum TaxID=1167516 RepID=UPI0025495E65|nr:GMC oxidoreductase [Penicillium odoratum]KAJ5772391.1 GMC oxidoreductase [Penicillium odoratum]